ncbi:unnamed protein product [Prorocentrum cordatum]|uniref:Domain of unknown function at the cortex 1 domain-containing protein n=1 Tax=Prorocentrum cordatum TaxID=2364126 RepID=A0ABN9WE40_9DINO|nr:unnamed protein product [Polarella glacialis]
MLGLLRHAWGGHHEVVTPWAWLFFPFGALCGALVARWLQRQEALKTRGRHAAAAAQVCSERAVGRSVVPVVPAGEPGEVDVPRSQWRIQGRMLSQFGEGVGGMVHDNELAAFSNDTAEGEFITFHRPTNDPARNKSGEYQYSEVFEGRGHLWEARCQLRIKKEPDGPLLFGIENDQYVPIAAGAKHALAATVSAMRMAVGKELHHSVGDDPEEVAGEVERPVFVMPIWTIDQVIETPPGQQPPSLLDPDFQSLGLRRGKDRNFAEAVRACRFREGYTYSVAFFSIAKFLDQVRWEICGVLPGLRLGFNTFCGGPPVHLAFYTLDRAAQERLGTKKHLDSCKQYYFRMAFWSTRSPPSPARRQALLSGLGEAGRCDRPDQQPAAAGRGASEGLRPREPARAQARRGRGRGGGLRALGALGGCLEGLLPGQRAGRHGPTRG